MPVQILSGTSGYSYKEWCGRFYPEKIPARDMLRHYATQLPAVEINNTFYRMPKTATLEQWRSQVTEEFRFAIKASQRITHKKRLKDVKEEVQYLFDALCTLGPQLGAVLFQLPPWLQKDSARLATFCELLPADTPVALEVRHQSWLDDEVFDILRARNVALCLADTDDGAPEFVSTANFGYLRLRRAEYTEDQLRAWRQRLAEPDWDFVYVFFKHEDDCGGPGLARQFLDLKRG